MKTPEDSVVIMTEIVYPNDTNPMGILQGGKLMHWMDTASAICAQTHSENISVTASIDRVAFKKPICLGDIVTIKAKITRAFDTSMEIYIEVKARTVKKAENILTNTAYFTFVALSDNKKPTKVPALKPVSDIEIEEYKNALKRKTFSHI
jgi:acyl-CoA hydrolase